MDYAIVFERLNKETPYRTKQVNDLIEGEEIILRESSPLLVCQLAKLLNKAFEEGLMLGRELQMYDCSLD